MRTLLGSIGITRNVKPQMKHGGGRTRSSTSKACGTARLSLSWPTPLPASAQSWVSSAATIAWKASGRGCASWKNGNKEKLVWLHREAEEFLDAYLAAAVRDADAPLFQSLDKAHRLTGDTITRRDMLRVVKERGAAAGLSEEFCNHTFRVTGITVFHHNGGALEAAQGHGESLRSPHHKAV